MNDVAERIELRTQRRLYGVIVGGTALVIQHGRELLQFDLWETLARGEAVFIERVLGPRDEGEPVAHPVE